MSKVLIVLGMHRSGTSVVSQWLSKCELNLGDRFAKPGMSNPRGFFEDLDFLHMHEKALSYFNIENTGLIPPFNLELTDHQLNQLQQLIDIKNSNNDQWGWKEPRTCLFVKYYKSLIPNAKYFILYRDYPFVVESLVRRDIESLKLKYSKLSLDEQFKQIDTFEETGKKILSLINTYLSTWITYNQNILYLMSSLINEDYLVVKYTDLINRDEAIFKKLTEWKFKLTFHPFTSVFSSKLINEDLPEITFDPVLEQKAISIREGFEEYISTYNLFFKSVRG